jgi:hypothetical protein
MRKFWIALGLLCFCIHSKQAFASHLGGGEINYTYIGHDSFEVSIIRYYNCAGIDGVMDPLEVYPEKHKKFTVSPTQVSTIDITPVCSKAPCTMCQDKTCTYAFGLRKTISSVIVDLSSYSECNFIFGYEESSRSTLILKEANFYCETGLNKCVAKGHNSPVFVDDPLQVWCKNQCVQTYQRAVGESGDSLVYELTSPLSGPGAEDSYISGYTYDKPFDFANAPDTTWNPAKCEGLRYDKHTGEFRFKPTSEMATTIAYKVTQYKKDSQGIYQKAGFVERECMFWMMACPGNSLPVMSGINGTQETTIYACPDVELSFFIYVTDLNRDNLFFKWDKNIPGASFSYSGYRSVFKWKPKKSDVRKEPYYIYAYVNDDVCPLVATVEKRYAIYVKDSFPSYTYEKHDSLCGIYSFSAKPRDPGKELKYEWRINDKVVSTNSEFAYHFPQNGTYLLTGYLVAPVGCGTHIYDTIKISGLSLFDAGNDTAICIGDQVRLHARGGLKYKWKGNDILSLDTAQEPIVKPTETSTYYLEGIAKDGCSRSDSVLVRVVNVPDAILTKDTVVCWQPPLNNPVVLQAADLPGANYTWSPRTGIVGSYLSKTAKVRPSVTTTYKLQIQTPEGCSFTDSVTVTVLQGVKGADAGEDQIVCQGEKVTLKASGGVKYQWKPDPNLIMPLDQATVVAEGYASKYFYVTVTNQYGCSATDSVYVKVNPFKPGLVHPLGALCRGDTLTLHASGGTTYDWQPKIDIINANTSSPSIFPQHSLRYHVFITDTVTKCSFTDAVDIIVDTSCVWPGDANRDRKVDYLDLLSIGVGMDAEGPTRKFVNQWKAFTASNWNKFTGQAVNYKHIDCNGDGIIDGYDTLIIQQNYNKTHDTYVLPQQIGNSSDPVLGFRFEKDTFYAGDTVRARLQLGSNAKQIKDCYGIGWRYTYDDAKSVPNSFRFEYACDLFCKPDELQMYRPLPQGGEAAMVRISHQGFTGDGELASIEYILQDTLHAVYDPKGEKLWASINFAEALDSNGNILGLYLQSDSAVVMPKRSGQVTPPPPPPPADTTKHVIKIYPYPADQTLVVETGDDDIQRVTLCNLLGQVVYSISDVNKDKIEIPISQFRSGMYILLLETDSKSITQKVIILH